MNHPCVTISSHRSMTLTNNQLAMEEGGGDALAGTEGGDPSEAWLDWQIKTRLVAAQYSVPLSFAFLSLLLCTECLETKKEEYRAVSSVQLHGSVVQTCSPLRCDISRVLNSSGPHTAKPDCRLATLLLYARFSRPTPTTHLVKMRDCRA